jgi:hypothetical protein
MQDPNGLDSLDTRRAVRGFLARALDDLSGGSARPQLPSDLAGLSTDSDSEGIDACRRAWPSATHSWSGIWRHWRAGRRRRGDWPTTTP